MSLKSVFCIAITRLQAAHILEQLKNAGFSNRDVSLLFPEKNPAPDSGLETGGRTGAHATRTIGGPINWLAGKGILAIPGMGPFVVAGPIAPALNAAAVGAALGGITRALAGMGIPETEARHYERKVKTGNILLSVCARGAEQLAAAKKIFRALGALDISTVAEAGPTRDRSEDNPGALLFT